ncbi:MAG: hypothetical protein WC509_05540 [Candidatus Izemoplasmatales bacterium]
MPDEIRTWLLDETDPAVRLAALTDLLGRPADDAAVIEARRRMMADADIRRLMSAQNLDGSWGEPGRFYRDKYVGSVWTLLILAELGADSTDPGVKAACEYVLAHAQEPESGAFSVEESARTHTGVPGYVIPCLTGNMVYALIRLGFLDDPRTQAAIGWIVANQQADDGGFAGPRPTSIARLTSCFGKHSCHMGVAKALKALAAIPADRRSDAVKDKIAVLSEYFLIHRLYKKSHAVDEVGKPGWTKFGFPLMYQTDALELLGIFASLGIRDPRLDDAVALVAGKRNADGTWTLENTYNGKTRLRIERKGEPSRWITLKALAALSFYAPESVE